MMMTLKLNFLKLGHQIWRWLFKLEHATYTLVSNHLHYTLRFVLQSLRTIKVLLPIRLVLVDRSDNFDTLILVKGQQLQWSEMGALVPG